MTAPGVGRLVGFAIAAEIGGTKRFSSPRKLCGHTRELSGVGLRHYPQLAQNSVQARVFPPAQLPFRRDVRRFGPRGKPVARLAWPASPAPRRARTPPPRRRPARWLSGAEHRLLEPVLEPWRHGRLPLDGVRWLLKPVVRAGSVAAPRGRLT
ncbi:MAG: hypothetical protein ACXVII_45715 [Solirubrobacteraceae bacterium]